MINKLTKTCFIQLVVKRFVATISSAGPAQIGRVKSARMNIKQLEVGSVARGNFDRIIATPEIQLLNDIFKKSGHEIRIAGGAVRDLLTGSIPHDIDLATTATPSQMISFLSPHQKVIRLITTKAGERHGTITTRINDRVQYEVTTLRIDRKTDGRHAEVEFIQDWVLDAARRDLTINAMFLDMSGCLYDYFNGSEDLEKKLIRFVGDPVDRICEDYLRILRYFRFYCRYGCGQNHDPPTIDAIRSNLEGLTSVSGERIWTEMKRILVLSKCNVVIPLMFSDLNVGKIMGFKTNVTTEKLQEFARVHDLLFSVPEDVQPITLFASIISDDAELESIGKRCRFSNQELDIAMFIVTNRSNINLTEKGLKKKLALSSRPDQQLMRSFMIELLKYNNRFDDAQAVRCWNIPEFPFRGHLLREKVKKPSDIGRVMNGLKQFWADNNYELSDDEFVTKIDELLLQLSPGKK